MKLRNFLLALLLPTVAFAAADTQRELERLAQERNAALASAADPINRRYKAALDQLLRQATQSGNLDGAVQIRTAQQALEASPSTPSTPVTPLLSHIVNSTWVWWGSENITFLNGGKVRHSKGVTWEWTVDTTDPLKVHLETSAHEPYSITFESDYKTGFITGSGMNQATHRLK